MPESDEKNELGGLARSIDSLFSSAPPPADEALDSEVPAVEGPLEVAEPEQFEGDAPEPESAPAPPDLAPIAAESADEPATEPPAALPEPRDAPGLTEAHAESDDSDTDRSDPGGDSESAVVEAPRIDLESAVVEAPRTDPESAVVEAPRADPEAAVVEASHGDSEAVLEVTPAAVEVAPEPGPLSLAVESFLSGEGDAGRIRALATQHSVVREYDPVAHAVERLVHQAAELDALEPMQLASELLTPMVRSRIVQRLGQEHNEARRAVYHAVCTALGEEMALAMRDEMAETGDRSARRAYFDALVAMGDVSRPVIEAMAEDENRFVARNGVAILGEVGGPRAVELVTGALANTDPRVRCEALRSMARLKVENAEEIIVGRLVDDSEASVRLAAVVTAGELRVERAVRPLVAALDEAYEPDDVLPLLHALGQIGDPGAVPSIEKHAVRELFAKPRTEVRIAAYQALDHIGTPHARRLLNQAVSDKDAEVKAAVKALLHMR